jgi:hypothetical protein
LISGEDILLVFTRLELRFKLPWNTEFFIEKHGSQECKITNFANREVRNITVIRILQRFSEVDDVKSGKGKFCSFLPSNDNNCL